MGEDYVIEVLSTEWIINSILSLLYMSIVLFIGFKLNNEKRLLFAKFISYSLIIFLLLYNFFHFYFGTWFIEKRLPLQLCYISQLICSIILFVPKKQHLFDVLFYCGFLGGIQALITPLIDDYTDVKFFYFDYYYVHSTIVLFPLYLFFVLKMKLTKYSWLKTFLFLNLLVVVIMPINFLLDSNYMYLSKPPNVNHPLATGIWPYYILKWEIFVLLLLYITYLIFNSRIFKN